MRMIQNVQQTLNREVDDMRQRRNNDSKDPESGSLKSRPETEFSEHEGHHFL